MQQATVEFKNNPKPHESTVNAITVKFTGSDADALTYEWSEVESEKRRSRNNQIQRINKYINTINHQIAKRQVDIENLRLSRFDAPNPRAFTRIQSQIKLLEKAIKQAESNKDHLMVDLRRLKRDSWRDAEASISAKTEFLTSRGFKKQPSSVGNHRNVTVEVWVKY